MLKNTQTNYGSVAKFFHWLIFIVVVWQFIVGFFVEDMEKLLRVSSLFPLHKLIGLATLLIIALRLLWLVYNPKPILPAAGKNWERFLAHATHALLYVSIIVMSLSGWMMSTAAGKAPKLGSYTLPMPGVSISKTLSTQAGDVHLIAAWVLLAFVSLHILAALKHHFINKDNVLKRMLPGK
ncbi:cytochrome b [soil metagenome]